METIIKGSKQKATLKIKSGLPSGLYLSTVDVQLEMFATNKRATEEEEKVIVKKSDMFFDGEETNEALLLFDTSEIGVNTKLLGELTLKYTDPDLGKEVTQKVLVTLTNEDDVVTDYKVVDLK